VVAVELTSLTLLLLTDDTDEQRERVIAAVEFKGV
jgi:hypothetical protein